MLVCEKQQWRLEYSNLCTCRFHSDVMIVLSVDPRAQRSVRPAGSTTHSG